LQFLPKLVSKIKNWAIKQLLILKFGNYLVLLKKIKHLMKRVLTGIQSTGVPHLGNILGAIVPAIELSRKEDTESFIFIADFHSLTTIKDAETRKKNVYSVAAAWIAFGFDTNKNFFYRQSKIPQVTELTWYLSCFTPFPILANAHSSKDN